MNKEALIRELSGMVPIQWEAGLPVARPAAAEEAARALTVAGRTGLAVAPRGGGSKAGLGAPPVRIDLVLSTEQLIGVVEYEPADLTVTVRAGTRFADLQESLRQHGQMLPLDPPCADRATVGGIVAANSMGPKRLAYGSVRDLVLGLRVALADGRVIRTGGRVVKNVAGYDMNKLFVGSLGTLGLITEVTLRVRPLPEAAETVLAVFPAAEGALACAEALLNCELLPVAVVVLSPGPARRLADASPYLLAVALEESPTNVSYQADRVGQAVTRAGGQVLGALAGESEHAFWAGVRNYRADLCCRVNTVMSDLAREFSRTELAGNLETGAIAWVGTGQVCLYAGSGPVEALERAATAWMRPASGTAVLETAPEAIRGRAQVWTDPGPAFRLMVGIKRTFDPAGILNPGRFVGGL